MERAIDHGGTIDEEVTVKVVAPGGGGGGTLGVLEVALLLRPICRRQRVPHPGAPLARWRLEPRAPTGGRLFLA